MQHSAETEGLTGKGQDVVAKPTDSLNYPNYTSNSLLLDHEDNRLPTEHFQCKKSHRKKEQMYKKLLCGEREKKSVAEWENQ